jgi:hypothetical protein
MQKKQEKGHIFQEYKMLFDMICLSHKRANWNFKSEEA